ncbi:Flp pilus assembly protein CpaB [Brevundimonas sp.]|uniref:Flp pilus assembly protein CpaB n=1 Tax=Brevundimonas sp. TaxID=1871086 RepID=UPI0028A7129E|nr:Flp pilus assembly protein CpaB [Brevundimonas sp.]
MKPARIVVICIAAVSAIGLALVVRAMGSSSHQPVAPAAAAPVETRPMTRVLVANADLTPGKRLTEADLQWKEWPVDEVDPSFITDGSNTAPPKDAKPTDAAAKADAAVQRVARAASDLAGPGVKSDYIGSVVRERILAGEPILPRKIVRAGDSGYMAAYLEPGMRAMAIGVTVESAAGGFILPGDRVDVVMTRELDTPSAEGGTSKKAYASDVVMQNIKVLAIDQTTRAGPDAQSVVGATATLEVRPQDAELLAKAKSEGELSLSLRSYADTGGPSGSVGRRTADVSAPRSVRIYRGGAPEVVVTP